MLSPLGLAFVGDAIFELMVRERLLSRANAPVNILHKNTVEYVKAESQSKSVNLIIDMLTEEETAIYKRGRNANGNVPKSCSPVDYRRATGLETLFGYLYLNGELDRVHTLFDVIWNHREQMPSEQANKTEQEK